MLDDVFGTLAADLRADLIALTFDQKMKVFFLSPPLTHVRVINSNLIASDAPAEKYIIFNPNS